MRQPSDIAYLIIEKIEHERTILINRVTKGACASWEDYKFVVGKLQGLDQSCLLTRELLKELQTGKKESPYASEPELY
jgi:hypothetical protein